MESKFLTGEPFGKNKFVNLRWPIASEAYSKKVVIDQLEHFGNVLVKKGARSIVT